MASGLKRSNWRLVIALGIAGGLATHAGAAQASLIGTDLTFGTLAQATSTSSPLFLSFPRTVTVTDPGIEFPDVGSLFIPGTPVPPGFANSLVDVAVDAGADFITIDFDNSAPFSQFAFGFQNTYVFTFDSAALVDITGASVNTAVTTLDLTQSRLNFTGNQLFVNVQGLPFNTNTFARIDLTVTGGPTTPTDPTPTPVPEPSTLAIFMAGLAGIAGVARRRRAIR